MANQTSGIQGSGVSSEEKSDSHCVVYRTGGTANFKWHRSLAMSRDQAVSRRNELQHMGYSAHVADYQRSLTVGLPETFS